MTAVLGGCTQANSNPPLLNLHTVYRYLHVERKEWTVMKSEMTVNWSAVEGLMNTFMSSVGKNFTAFSCAEIHEIVILIQALLHLQKESSAFTTCSYKKHRSFRNGRTNICSFWSIWRSITLPVVLRFSYESISPIKEQLLCPSSRKIQH